MPERQKDHGRIAMGAATDLPGGRDQRLDLLLGEPIAASYLVGLGFDRGRGPGSSFAHRFDLPLYGPYRKSPKMPDQERPKTQGKQRFSRHDFTDFGFSR
jgi:hypothetical protein